MTKGNLLFTQKGTSIFDEYYQFIDSQKLYSDLDEKLALYAENTIALIERNLHDLNELKSSPFVSSMCIEYLAGWFPIFKELVNQDVFIKAFSYNSIVFANSIYNCSHYNIVELSQVLIFFKPYRGDISKYNEKIKEYDLNNKLKVLSGEYSSLKQDNQAINKLMSFLNKKEKTINPMIKKFFLVMYLENKLLFEEFNNYLEKENISFPLMESLDVEELEDKNDSYEIEKFFKEDDENELQLEHNELERKFGYTYHFNKERERKRFSFAL